MPRSTPERRTRPAASRPRAAALSYVPPDQVALKAAHLALVGDYLAVLNYVTPRAAFAPSDALPGFGIVFRPAIRLLIHLHVRKQLQSIADAYVQLTAVFEAGDTYRAWLTEAADACSQVRDTLFTFRRPSILNVIPALIAVIPLLIAFGNWYAKRISENVDELPLSTNAWIGFAVGYVVFFGALFGAAFYTAFRWKRQIFAPVPDNTLARNVYARENELFQILGRTKRVEAALDLWLTGALLVVVALGMTVAADALPKVLGYLLLAVILPVSGVAGFWTTRAFTRRRASGLQ